MTKLSTRLHQGDLVPATIGRGLATALPMGAIALVLAVASCGPQMTTPTTDVLGNQVKLAPASQGDVPGSLVFRAPDLDTRPPPRCFYIPDTIIDTGKEAVFVDVNDQQKQVVAEEVTNAFRKAIGQHQRVSPTAAPTCATLQLYLTGIHRTVPNAGSEADYGILMGGLGAGQNRSVYGAITVAGRFTAPDGTVLAGFVNKMESNSFNISPTATPRQIAMLTAQRLANEIASEVDQEVAVQRSNQKP
jgi:hypothetical protein